MTPRHRLEPVRSGSAVRRAVVTSVLAAVALASVTITAAGVTLTNSPSRRDAPAAEAAPTSTSSSAPTEEPTLAPPIEIEDVPVGIPDVALVAANGPLLDAIPDSALAAYQRAAAVLLEADQQCHLEWTLLAAIGQVVTGHGTTGGGELNKNGVMRPSYAGKPLVGGKGTKIPDSDAGRLDGDRKYDRPVGPMQLAPSTWSVVGVDGDGDGRRNPNDIDDASLAVSVLLCQGDDDLRKRHGRISAVQRINDDNTFIETVLAVDRGYRTQVSEAADDDPILVAKAPYTDLPTDLPTNDGFTPTDPSDEPTDEPTDDPTPVTWPNPSVPTDDPTDPTDPTDDPSDTPCPTDAPSDSSTDDSCPAAPSDSATPDSEATD